MSSTPPRPVSAAERQAPGAPPRLSRTEASLGRKPRAVSATATGVVKSRNARASRPWPIRLLELFSPADDAECERQRIIERDHVNAVLECSGEVGRLIKVQLAAREAAQAIEAAAAAPETPDS